MVQRALRGSHRRDRVRGRRRQVPVRRGHRADRRGVRQQAQRENHLRLRARPEDRVRGYHLGERQGGQGQRALPLHRRRERGGGARSQGARRRGGTRRQEGQGDHEARRPAQDARGGREVREGARRGRTGRRGRGPRRGEKRLVGVQARDPRGFQGQEARRRPEQRREGEGDQDRQDRAAVAEGAHHPAHRTVLLQAQGRLRRAHGWESRDALQPVPGAGQTRARAFLDVRREHPRRDPGVRTGREDRPALEVSQLEGGALQQGHHHLPRARARELLRRPGANRRARD